MCSRYSSQLKGSFFCPHFHKTQALGYRLWGFGCSHLIEKEELLSYIKTLFCLRHLSPIIFPLKWILQVLDISLKIQNKGSILPITSQTHTHTIASIKKIKAKSILVFLWRKELGETYWKCTNVSLSFRNIPPGVFIIFQEHGFNRSNTDYK